MKPIYLACILSLFLHGLLLASAGWSPTSLKRGTPGPVLVMRIAKENTIGIQGASCDPGNSTPPLRGQPAPVKRKILRSLASAKRTEPAAGRAKVPQAVLPESREGVEGKQEVAAAPAIATKSGVSSENPLTAAQPEETGLPDEYEALILERIAREKRYPLRAKRRRMEGEVSLRFFLLSDGGVKEEGVVAPYRAESILREAAVETLRRAAPFPPPPPAYRKAGGIQMAVKIRYRLEGRK